MASDPIEHQEARIRTGSVRIKIMEVDHNKLTLAGFRQFVEEPIEDEKGELRGTPWGWVNYHPDGCNGQQHLHIPWRLDGDNPRRARVSAPQREEWVGRKAVRRVQLGDTLINSAIVAGWRPDPDSLIHARGGEDCILIRFRGGLVGVNVPQSDLTHDSLGHLHWTRKREEEAHAMRKIGDVMLLDQAVEAVEAELRKQDAEYALRKANWELFNSLPQLFIAI